MKYSSVIKYFRWILGGVLMIAGILKIASPDNLVEVILFFDLLSENSAHIFVYSASVIEILLAAGLFLQFKPKLTAIVVSSLCFVFLLISLVGYANNWEIVCGCLGEFTYGNFDLLMIVRNMALMGMAFTISYAAFKIEETPKGVN